MLRSTVLVFSLLANGGLFYLGWSLSDALQGSVIDASEKGTQLQKCEANRLEGHTQLLRLYGQCSDLCDVAGEGPGWRNCMILMGWDPDYL